MIFIPVNIEEKFLQRYFQNKNSDGMDMAQFLHEIMAEHGIQMNESLVSMEPLENQPTTSSGYARFMPANTPVLNFSTE
jgi:hypothetical protein